MKTKKILIIISLTLIIIGMLISLITFKLSDFSIDDFYSLTYVTNEYNELGDFENIKIDSNFNVHIMTSNEIFSPKIVCDESEELYNEVFVDSNNLIIKQKDKRKTPFDFIGIYGKEIKIDIYLPIYSEYKNINVNSTSGNITVTRNLTFTKADIKTSSGTVTFNAYVKNDIDINTLSGSIYMTDTKAQNIDVSATSSEILLSDITAYERLDAQSVSGDIVTNNCKSSYSHISTTSGDIELINYIVENDVGFETTSGDIELDDCDAKNLDISTTSGDVSGTLISEKIFSTSTTSGDINIPQSIEGGMCKVETTSGDINIDINK